MVELSTVVGGRARADAPAIIETMINVEVFIFLIPFFCFPGLHPGVVLLDIAFPYHSTALKGLSGASFPFAAGAVAVDA